MKYQTPNLLICLGPSLAGKTTFIKTWQKEHPEHEHVDDRPVVMEYLALDALVHEAASTDQLTTELRNFAATSKYLSDLADQYISEINETARIPKPRYCIQTIDHGQGDRRPALDYQIGHPSVWDDIMVRLGKSLEHDQKYILEFARGHRDIYLTEHNIRPEDVYPKALSCLLSSMPKTLRQSAAIVHLTCNFDERFKRNDIRRKTTGQELPDSVLCDVFKKDNFETAQATQDVISHYSTQVDGLEIPTVTIRNDRQRDPKGIEIFFENVVENIGRIHTCPPLAEIRPYNNSLTTNS